MGIVKGMGFVPAVRRAGGGSGLRILARSSSLRLAGVVVGLLASAVLSGQTPIPTLTRPRLTGGFGRLPGTPIAAPVSDTDFLDPHALSFDTRGYDWSAYAPEMVRRIKLHWDVPELARLGSKGSLMVRFYILADGRVADAKVIRSSGIPPFDSAALQAVLSASPFRPLPQELHEEREGVTLTFFYNMRPDAGARAPTPVPQAAASPAGSPSAPDIGLPAPRTATGFGNVGVDQPNFRDSRYIERLVQIISLNWYKPAQAIQTNPVIHFQIERDGTITNPRVVVSSGLAYFDRAAMRAVASSSPLPPLPANFDGPHLGIQVVFQ